MSISGPGAGLLTISGNQTSRAFLIDSPNLIQITLSGLTIANGQSSGGSSTINYGGAIYCTNESLTVNNCVFTNNRAGWFGGVISVDNGGSLTVIDSRFENNGSVDPNGASGAAIYVQGGSQLIVQRSSFVNNTTSVIGGLGGAVMFDLNNPTGIASVQIADSLFTGNSARRGGAIYIRGFGNFAELVIQNSTIHGNASLEGGGGVSLDTPATLVIRNSTITGNTVALVPTNYFGGGGVERLRFNGTLNLISSIVAGNTSPVGPDIGQYSPLLARHSAIGTSDGYVLSIDSENNLPVGIDLKLGPHTNNGGPTLTRAISTDSPLYNAGINPASLPFDQRGPGFPRTVDSLTDIGAFEYRPGTFVSPTASVIVNKWSAQRSQVTSLTVNFSQPVVVPAGLGAAIKLTRSGSTGPTGTINLAFSQSGNVIDITFADPIFAPIGGSLIDGQYKLKLVAGMINGGQFDGNGDGNVGDDQIVSFHRLFADADGNGTVNSSDFATFRTVFGIGPSMFDFNNDGQTNSEDFAEFRKRFGITLVP